MPTSAGACEINSLIGELQFLRTKIASDENGWNTCFATTQTESVGDPADENHLPLLRAQFLPKPNLKIPMGKV